MADRKDEKPGKPIRKPTAEDQVWTDQDGDNPYQGEIAAYKVWLAMRTNGMSFAHVEASMGDFLYRGQLGHALATKNRGRFSLATINQLAVVVRRPLLYLASNAWPAGEPVPPFADDPRIDPGSTKYLTEVLPQLIMQAKTIAEDAARLALLANFFGKFDPNSLPMPAVPVAPVDLPRSVQIDRINKYVVGPFARRGPELGSKRPKKDQDND